METSCYELCSSLVSLRRVTNINQFNYAMSPSVRILLTEEIGTRIRMTVIHCYCHVDRCGSTEICSDVALMRLSQLWNSLMLLCSFVLESQIWVVSFKRVVDSLVVQADWFGVTLLHGLYACASLNNSSVRKFLIEASVLKSIYRWQGHNKYDMKTIAKAVKLHTILNGLAPASLFIMKP